MHYIVAGRFDLQLRGLPLFMGTLAPNSVGVSDNFLLLCFRLNVRTLKLIKLGQHEKLKKIKVQ